MIFTVVGASGFIGGSLVRSLRTKGYDVRTPSRSDIGEGRSLEGHVIYAAGVTSDFRIRTFDALEANTTLVANCLQRGGFDSFVYLSSTRVYRHGACSSESDALSVCPSDPEDLYDLTKLTAEAMCYVGGKGKAKVVRLSNVVGEDLRSRNFLFDVTRSACTYGSIELRSDAESVKDYIVVEDVVDMIPEIAVRGRFSCYNLASGINLTHREVVELIASCAGARWTVVPGAPRTGGPQIDIRRLREEFGFSPRPLPPALFRLVAAFRRTQRAAY